MMKKIITLFLVGVIGLSLVACGGTESTSENSGNLLKKEKEIEITADNWQEYFEFKYDLREDDGWGNPHIEMNAFNEIEDVEAYVDMYFCLKEDYVDSFVSVDVAIEVNGKEAEVGLIRYNVVDGTYEVLPCEVDLSDDRFSEMLFNASNRTETAKVESIKTDIDMCLWTMDYDFTIDGDFIEFYFATLPNAEVTRIQGTLVIKE